MASCIHVVIGLYIIPSPFQSCIGLGSRVYRLTGYELDVASTENDKVHRQIMISNCGDYHVPDHPCCLIPIHHNLNTILQCSLQTTFKV